MLQVVDTARVPPGGVFRYIDSETGQEFVHPYFEQVFVKATKYRIANNLPIPTDWEEHFSDNVCRSTPTCPCKDDADQGPPSIVMRAVKLAVAMTQWAQSGFALADEAEIERRKSFCQGLNGQKRCKYWRKGRLFGRCGKCGCSTELKLPVATERCPLGLW